MSIYVDKKFVGMISGSLERFHAKSNELWNFRCPICGDSKTNKLKARGYIYRRKDGLFFSCKNCNASMSMGNLIKAIDPPLYREYLMENYKENSPSVPKPDFSKFTEWSKDFDVTLKEPKTIGINLPKISSLPEDHAAKLFLLNRKIPRKYLDDMYYTVDFASFIEELIPDKKTKFYPNEKRIVIPWQDEHNNLLGVQGRILAGDAIRYISVKLKDENRKIFGLNTVDFTQPIKVVEGPIDSLFLTNTLATMDSSLYNIIPHLGDYDYVFIPDNEPRNPDICRVIQKTIDLGQKVVIWPSSVEEKDINDMILAGRDSLELERIIANRTFDGLRANLEFNTWKKT